MEDASLVTSLHFLTKLIISYMFTLTYDLSTNQQQRHNVIEYVHGIFVKLLVTSYRL